MIELVHLRIFVALVVAVAGCGQVITEETPADAPPLLVPLSATLPYRGVNLSVAEWGMNSDGSGSQTFGDTYTYPDPTFAFGYTSAEYFLRKGMTTFRLPFRWEALQPTRGQAFDPDELGRLRTTVGHLRAQGAAVILDPHNYARYGTSVIGSVEVPNSDFADLWARLAMEYGDDAQVLFGLVNEPYDLPTEQWVSAANAAIAAIRATGATNTILVAGNQWDSAMAWNDSFYGTPNGVALLQIVDPLDKVVFEAHQYLDATGSGADSSCVSPTIGSERVRPFTDWLRANGKKGFLGEFAVGSDVTCMAALNDLLAHLEANQDVYVGWTYWAAGPWWGDSWYSLEPNGATDKPQMLELERYLVSPTVADDPSLPPQPIPFATGIPFALDSGTTNYVYVPDRYDRSHQTPTTLFVWLHGCGGESSGDIWTVSPGGSQDWISLAVGGAEGDCWNMTTGPGIVLAAIADVKTHFNIKPHGVILGGYSSGGDLSYRTAFFNARSFAGILVANTAPFRDIGSSPNEALGAASWKFNIVHLAHLQDTTYPIDLVRAETDDVAAAGFPISRIEVDGGHWDAPGAWEHGHAVPGTSADIATFLLPNLDAGWASP